MFVLKTLGRYILGNPEQKELFQISGGVFWQTETKKNVINRIRVFERAEVALCRRGEPFEFDLLVSEEQKNKEDEKWEKNAESQMKFGLCAGLQLDRRYDEEGCAVLCWSDAAEKYRYEYVFGLETTAATVEMLHVVVAQCLFENVQRRPHSDAHDREIQKLVVVTRHDEKPTEGHRLAQAEAEVEVEAEGGSVFFLSDTAVFYVFDGPTNTFLPKDLEPVKAVVSVDAKCNFKLKIVGDSGSVLHSQKVDPDATLYSDRKNSSLIWNHFSDDGFAWTFSLRFAEPLGLMGLSNALGQAIYEILNHEKASKLTPEDRTYLLNPFSVDVEMGEPDAGAEANPNAPAVSDSEDEHEDEYESESATDQEEENGDGVGAGDRKGQNSTEGTNQQLAIGFKNDRSFVTRGHSIAVFKHTADEQIELHTKIDRIQTTKGKTFSPTKMMLHDEDRSLILMDAGDQNHLYKMDLEYGRVVEDWTVHRDAKVSTILPDSKYAQMTANQTFIGLNANSIFRIDPRLAGDKRVDSEMKQYVVKNDFTCGATTGQGELAVASGKGEIRLFNKLDKRAKTLLPGFGDSILGIDVTESGRYIVATCKTYLLLICTEIPGGDSLGFSKAMGANKPVPRRLQLKPEHISYMNAPVSFTPARFSTGQGEERSIITSTGPFVITWNLRRVKQGRVYDYQIRKYEDKVVADNFRFGQDRSIVVTLPHHVTMISKKSLAAASPHTLAGTRRSTRAAGLAPDPLSGGDVVDSPY